MIACLGALLFHPLIFANFFQIFLTGVSADSFETYVFQDSALAFITFLSKSAAVLLQVGFISLISLVNLFILFKFTVME